MSDRILALVGCSLLACLPVSAPGQPGDGKKGDQGPVIKDVYKNHFLIGMAGDIPGNYTDEELGLVRGHFNVVTPENCMKPGPVHPAEDKWNFERPDALVKWCGEKKLANR
jgi:GH35 family endo-1,4-beta-xylanase